MSAHPALILAASLLLIANSHAVLVNAGVTDGDLTGGNPKAVIMSAAAPVADLSLWGFGSANNGGGTTDGQEFTFPAGTANTGDIFVIAANAGAFSGLTEQQHIDVFVAAGFTQVALPEPGSSALLMLGLGALLRRRR